ncbi:MAG: hypothetical protein WCR52_01815 [Bacteroidota bacterium]
MKYLMIFVVLCAIACQRNNDVTALAPDIPVVQPEDTTANSTEEFVFGITGWQAIPGKDVARLFKLKNNLLYKDSMMYYFPSYMPTINYKTTPLSAEETVLAQKLFTVLPTALLSVPEGSIGCPGCDDTPACNVEITQNGIRRRWVIEPTTPAYAAFCDSIWTTVAKLGY